MACTLHVAWDERLTSYNFGPAHPLAPVRVELPIELARAVGVVDAEGVIVAPPEPATDAELEYTHDNAYIAAVKQAGSGGRGVRAGRDGLGTADDPLFPGMHQASALVAGAAPRAPRGLLAGPAHHRGDHPSRTAPLARLELTSGAQRAAHAAIHELAHETAGGRWLLTGGGGYEIVQVVPRTWTHLLAEAAGRPLDPAIPTPQSWRDYVARRTRATAPELMTEQAPARYQRFENGYDPADPIDPGIMATRKAVFPHHGLMP